MNAPNWTLAIATFLFGIVVGQTLTRITAEPAPAQTAELPWFQDDAKCDDDDTFYGRTCHVKLRPRKMTLEFVDRERFDTMWRQIDQENKANGFARIVKSPCEIVIPLDKTEIVYHPFQVTGYARFEGMADDTTLAHEILHCYIGLWHADVKSVQFRQNIQLLKGYRASLATDIALPRLPVQRWERGLFYQMTEGYQIANSIPLHTRTSVAVAETK